MKKAREEINSMTKPERIAYFAGGRATTKKITQVLDNGLKESWMGKVRGFAIQKNGEFLFDTWDEAYYTALDFVRNCRREVEQ